VFDFPIDCYLTGGSGMFIARYINMFVFPLQCIYTYITNTVYYFKRDAVYDKELFNKNVYNNLLNSNCININIYQISGYFLCLLKPKFLLPFYE
jgi:hypothetical protein